MLIKYKFPKQLVCLLIVIELFLCNPILFFTTTEIQAAGNLSEATSTNSILINEILIKKVDSLALSCSIEIVNQSNNDLSDAKCFTDVYSDANGDMKLVNTNSVDLTISALQKKTLSIVHKYPYELSKGAYTLNTRVVNKDGDELAMVMRSLGEISSEKTSNTIKLDSASSYFVQGGKNVSLPAVKSYDIGDKPSMKINVENTSTSDVSGKVYLRLFDSDSTNLTNPVLEKELSDFVLKSSEKNDISVELPAINEAKGYLVEISLKDNDKKIISDILRTPILVLRKGFSLSQITAEHTGNAVNFAVTAEFILDISDTDVINVEMNITQKDNQKKVYTTTSAIKSKGINEAIVFNMPATSATGDILANATLYHNSKNVANGSSTFNMKTLLDAYNSKIQASQNKINFTDVAGTKYESAVNNLVNKKIISGYENNTFRPLNNITRAECMTIVCCLLGAKNSAEQNKEKPVFSDVPKSHWARGFINVGFNLNIISGYPDETFKPQDNMKYSEVLTVCVKIINNGIFAQKSKLPWPDNYIEEAKNLGLTKDVNFSPTNKAIRGNIAIFFSRVLDLLNKSVAIH